jgi:Zn-dependent peptidase ImmA (M78 family)
VTPIRPRYTRIERLVKELLVRAEITTPPVNVKKIANMSGATVQYEQFGEDVSGVLIRNAGGNVIGVQKTQSQARQRFTIAHELGHLLLHEGKPIHVDKAFRVNWRRDDPSKPRDIEEIEANSFAAHLLMPKGLVEVVHGSTSFELEDDTEIGRLAAVFEVSKQAMNFRLIELFGRSTFA